MWADPIILEVPGATVSFRATPGDVEAALRAALAPHLVEGAEASIDYRLQIASDPRSFHVLYWNGCVALRTRDPARLSRAIAAHIGGHQPARGARTGWRAAVSAAGSAVAVAGLRRTFARLDRHIRASGGFPVDTPWLDLDVDARRVSTGPTSLPPSTARRIQRAVHGLPRGPAEASVTSGTWPLGTIAVAGTALDGSVAGDLVALASEILPGSRHVITTIAAPDAGFRVHRLRSEREFVALLPS